VPGSAGAGGLRLKLTAQSAERWRRWTSSIGALAVGRTLFDYTDGCKGVHPLGVPVTVLTTSPRRTGHTTGLGIFSLSAKAKRHALAVPGDRSESVLSTVETGRLPLRAGALAIGGKPLHLAPRFEDGQDKGKAQRKK
jgi:hypothetical protein